MKARIKILLTVFISIFLLLGFALPLNMIGNWFQQFMPNLNGRQITDITFIDSLTGFAVTNNITQNDTGFILKTTNGGDNWNFKFADLRYFTKVKFINTNTGFVTGGAGNGAKIYKTINAGENWSPLNIPGGGQLSFEDISVLSEDTFWVVASNSLVGGVWRTTNGGGSWENQLFLGSQNPTKIYMYNARIGFVALNTGSPYIRKTTNSGLNWDTIVNGKGFSDMFFIDSLKGWTAFDSVRKTTNGGINWQTQVLPYGGHMGGFLNYSYIFKFSQLTEDTIWGVGGRIAFPNTQLRGLIYRTTNGGNNWQFQLPDTSINIGQYLYVKFVNKNIGWAYSGFRGIHTISGGDPIWITGIKQISSQIPGEFKLFQNYPNPFNPKTIIKYQIVKNTYVNLIIYDVTGKKVIDLVNRNQKAGTYEVDFSGIGYSSGVYFYSLIVDDKLVDTKRMIFVK